MISPMKWEIPIADLGSNPSASTRLSCLQSSLRAVQSECLERGSKVVRWGRKGFDGIGNYHGGKQQATTGPMSDMAVGNDNYWLTAQTIKAKNKLLTMRSKFAFNSELACAA